MIRSYHIIIFIFSTYFHDLGIGHRESFGGRKVSSNHPATLGRKGNIEGNPIPFPRNSTFERRLLTIPIHGWGQQRFGIAPGHMACN